MCKIRTINEINNIILYILSIDRLKDINIKDDSEIILRDYQIRILNELNYNNIPITIVGK